MGSGPAQVVQNPPLDIGHFSMPAETLSPMRSFWQVPGGRTLGAAFHLFQMSLEPVPAGGQAVFVRP